MRRRDAVRLGLGAGAVATAGGARLLQEAITEAADSLNGECDRRTDTITLDHGDAVVYRMDDEDYYLELEDHWYLNGGTTARYGPAGAEKERITVHNEPVERDDVTLEAQESNRFYHVHLNLLDALSGDDVIEPRGTGMISDKLEATYDDPVCIIESGEASEMRHNY